MPIGPRFASIAPLAVVLLLALYPIFYDLGGPPLWEDETDTVAFAHRILDTGLPVAWDGRIVHDADHGLRIAPHALGHDFVMVGTPWLPFYATAGSIALFGSGNGAARLPFAIGALGTIALLYAFVLRMTGCRRAALAAAILLVSSTQFLLYARESRSYAFNMLFTVALLWSFGEMRNGGRRIAAAAVLVASAVLLFHTQILPAAVAVATCGMLALFHPRFRPQLPALLWLAPCVALLTLPWVALTWYETQTNWHFLVAGRGLLQRVGQFAAESMVAIPWIGWIAGLVLLRRRFTRGDRDLLAIALCFVAMCFALLPLVLPKTVLLTVGIRYVCALIPIGAAVTSVLVARASTGRPFLYGALLVLFGATHLAGNALPWLAIDQTRHVLTRDGPFVSVPRSLAEKLFGLHGWYLVRGLGVREPGTLSALADFVNANTDPDDILVTNFASDGLYLHTKRRQGYRIAPNAKAAYEAARASLPSYVTSLDGVDWLVWRHAAAPLPGMGFDEAQAELASRGARVEAVASFRDGVWENRPELHWHRFPRVGFPFAPRHLGAEGPRFPDAVVYRVLWPDETPDGMQPAAR